MHAEEIDVQHTFAPTDAPAADVSVCVRERGATGKRERTTSNENEGERVVVVVKARNER